MKIKAELRVLADHFKMEERSVVGQLKINRANHHPLNEILSTLPVPLTLIAKG